MKKGKETDSLLMLIPRLYNSVQSKFIQYVYIYLIIMNSLIFHISEIILMCPSLDLRGKNTFVNDLSETTRGGEVKYLNN